MDAENILHEIDKILVPELFGKDPRFDGYENIPKRINQLLINIIDYQKRIMILTTLLDQNEEF